jgi:hypothetical protein
MRHRAAQGAHRAFTCPGMRKERLAVIEITHDMIARRAFEISLVDPDGDPAEHWRRAEQELRREAGLPERKPPATDEPDAES